MGLLGFWKKKDKHSEKEKKFNKMWDLWAEGKAASPYAELMTYQSEINNGGHDQYFANVENTGDLQKEISALEKILPEGLKCKLQGAYQAYLLLKENEADEEARETMERCDGVFYENEGEINLILQEYASEMEV